MKEYTNTMEEQERKKYSEPPEVLLEWEITEEKHEYSKNREYAWAVIGLTITTIAFFLSLYVLAFFSIIATGTFIFFARRPPQKYLFTITDAGIVLGNELVPFEDIIHFNVIDDPGDQARLILEMQGLITLRVDVPIYDLNMDDIADIFFSYGVPADETLNLSLIDKAARFF